MASERKHTCCYRWCTGVKYLVFMQIAIFAIVVIPIVIIVYWKPYEMYCLSRLDTTLKVPDWCWDTFPNVYNYVQH